MESSKTAVAFKSSAATSDSEKVSLPETTALRLTPRMTEALAMLLDALECAEDLDCNVWDFAVEMSSLRRLNVSNSELRWMIAKGLLEHAIEITLAGDLQRSFRQPIRPIFCKRASFVLTAAGAILARDLRDQERNGSGAVGRPRSYPNSRVSVQVPWLSITAKPEALVPKWDRDRQELKLGSIVVKRFKVPAANQESILAAFEEESWPPRIDDPLPPHPDQSSKRRLQVTIKSLNRNQKRRLIRFLGDGSGQGVRWEFCGEQDADTED